MNITDEITKLENEAQEQWKIKWKAHARVIELKGQIKKLRTISKHAEEVLVNKVQENGQVRI